MSDCLARLMQWVACDDIDDAHIVLRDAITEIAGLRARLHELRLAIRRLADQDATLSVQGGNVIVEIDATLTDAEREAVAWCRDNITAMAHPSSAFAHIHAATLRGLLERTGGGT